MYIIHQGVPLYMFTDTEEFKKDGSIEPGKILKQNVFVIERHLQLFEGQQHVPSFNLLSNTIINPKNNEIIYQLIKKLQR